MPRNPSPVLTSAELRLMRVLWGRGPSTVAEVRAGLARPRPAYNSVLTTLRILEEKGYVGHAKRGRAFVYEARVLEDAARSGEVRHLVGRLFGGSADRLVAHLLDHEELDGPTLARLRRLVDGEGR